ncbi:FAD-binding oxidoreductase, partial [Pseudomonadota bacterium]
MCVPFKDFDIDDEYRAEWDRLGLWRLIGEADREETRAYSVASYPGEGDILTLNVRIALPPPGSEGVPPGRVSSYLFSLKPGDQVNVSGPFGHFFVEQSEREMVFIGGGAGMAPMRAHIFDQLKHVGTKRKMSFWYGGRSIRELFYVEDFDALAAEHENFTWTIALSEPLPDTT